MQTTAQFKTWRFGYEYDFLYRDRGFLGVVFDVKYTDVNVGLLSPIGDEFTKALAPIPTIGARRPRLRREERGAERRGQLLQAFPRARRTTTRAATSTSTSTPPSTRTRTSACRPATAAIDVFYQAKNDTGTLTFKGLYFGGTDALLIGSRRRRHGQVR